MQTDKEGDWCDTWFGNFIPYCILSGNETAKFCPGAQIVPKTEPLLFATSDVEICSKSRRELILSMEKLYFYWLDWVV